MLPQAKRAPYKEPQDNGASAVRRCPVAAVGRRGITKLPKTLVAKNVEGEATQQCQPSDFFHCKYESDNRGRPDSEDQVIRVDEYVDMV